VTEDISNTAIGEGPAKRHQVHNLIILDESGSMASIKSHVIDGFNETLRNIKRLESENPDQEHFVSFMTFEQHRFTYLHFAQPSSQLQELDHSNYHPGGCTPLYDAIGMSCNRLKAHVASNEDHDVIVTILTDGMENASREYSQMQTRALIEELKAGKWAFTYIGTEHDITRVTDSLAIDSALYFSKDQTDMDKMFAKERMARRAYNRSSKEFSRMSHEDIMRRKMGYFVEEQSVERFKNAYDSLFNTALEEIRGGRKRGQWMECILPQIIGLDNSDAGVKYGVKDIHEATEMLFEPYLRIRERLESICMALLQLPTDDAEEVFGESDATKLRSSMTLFSQVPGAGDVFQRVLDKYFGGRPDTLTLDILDRQSRG